MAFLSPPVKVPSALSFLMLPWSRMPPSEASKLPPVAIGPLNQCEWFLLKSSSWLQTYATKFFPSVTMPSRALRGAPSSGPMYVLTASPPIGSSADRASLLPSSKAKPSKGMARSQRVPANLGWHIMVWSLSQKVKRERNQADYSEMDTNTLKRNRQRMKNGLFGAMGLKVDCGKEWCRTAAPALLGGCGVTATVR